MFPLSKKAWSQLCNVALLKNVKKRTRFRFSFPWCGSREALGTILRKIVELCYVITKSTANIQCTEVLADDGLGCECGTFLNSIMPIPKYFLLLTYFSPKVFNDVRKSV